MISYMKLWYHMSIEIIYAFTMYGCIIEYPMHVISILYFIHHEIWSDFDIWNHILILYFEIMKWFVIWNHILLSIYHWANSWCEIISWSHSYDFNNMISYALKSWCDFIYKSWHDILISYSMISCVIYAFMYDIMNKKRYILVKPSRTMIWTLGTLLQTHQPWNDLILQVQTTSPMDSNFWN